MSYTANEKRYDVMPYRRCGRSGLKLPRMSLGLWHNFGAKADPDNAREMLLGSFDLGITHFDIANNYGPPDGAAEITFGKIMESDLRPYRDEMIISTKAGYYMWPGPYGEWGSRKQLMASIDQSLSRMGLDYVDISITTAPTPTPRSKRRCRRSSTLCTAGRHCMWASATITPRTRAARQICSPKRACRACCIR